MSDEDMKGPPERGRKKNRKQGTRTQQISSDNIDSRLNRIKTKNKLIGEIQDNGLYKSDEDLDGFGANGHGPGAMQDDDGEDYQGKDIEIDFGANKEKNDGKVAKFLDKMKTKKLVQEKTQGVEQEIVNYGFVQAVAQKVSANQLAASGIQLSVREKLIKFIGQMDQEQMTKKEHQLLDVLKGSS